MPDTFSQFSVGDKGMTQGQKEEEELRDEMEEKGGKRMDGSGEGMIECEEKARLVEASPSKETSPVGDGSPSEKTAVGTSLVDEEFAKEGRPVCFLEI